MDEQDARTQILTAATAVIARKGFANASMNDIVRASGMSKGGVYWHFASKDDLIAAIFEQFFESQVAAVAALVAEEGSATAKLSRLVQMVAAETETLASQFPSSFEFYALAARDDRLRVHLADFFEQYRHHLSLLAQQAIADGEWVARPPAEIADAIIILFEGTLLLWGVFPNQFTLGSQIETAVDLLLAGIKNE